MRIEAIEKRLQTAEGKLDDNTALTKETRDDVSTLKSQLKPVVDGMQTMEAGIRTIGRIGTMGATVGKGILVCVALWVGFKAFVSGASWSEIAEAFGKVMGK